jgi:hypothetical protein
MCGLVDQRAASLELAAWISGVPALGGGRRSRAAAAVESVTRQDPPFLAAAMSSTIGVGLLAAGAAADAGTTADPTPSPLTSVPQAGEGASQVQGILRASAVEAAPWPAENGLVRVGPSALQAIQLGADGPDACSSSVWIGAFTVGMLGGVWAGLTLMPALEMPLAGGWFSCACIMAIPLFRLALQALRVQTAEGGLVAQVLGADVSPKCAETVAGLVKGIRILQAVFVVSQAFLYCAGVVMVMGDPRVRPDMAISMLVGMIALLVGSFQVAAMIVAVITSCEVLDDRCRSLVDQAAAAATAEELHDVYLAMRKLDHALQQAVVALRPIVATVSQTRQQRTDAPSWLLRIVPPHTAVFPTHAIAQQPLHTATAETSTSGDAAAPVCPAFAHSLVLASPRR